MRRLTKACHEIGAIVMMGSLAVCVVLVLGTTQEDTARFAAIRHSIVLVHKYLYVPSLAIAMISGLLAIALTNAYKDAGWA